ncbi:hypothetical protein GCM10007392_44870 [Saccharospirillum salsuginis]|uniref:Uncharacterized protein n=1 Tax=Saccharospirillum salsuginis TaxID=418750 RepID=A0A918KT70_9GAMM|nr:hypothetical protein GCM10007392_44870 [Saccharospirillum salsuginis]
MLDLTIYGAIGLLSAIYLYGASYISYCIAKSAMFDNWQKVIIIAMSWLIPIIGPAFIYRLLEDEIADTNIAKPPLVTYLYLSSDVSWSYGNGHHMESNSSGSESSGGDSS